MANETQVVVLGPGEGRTYAMGRISSVFKADLAETGNRYSVSEWFLEPYCKGPGTHAHPEDSIFYVIEGTMSLLVGDRWIAAPRGSFVQIPANLPHDFENRTAHRAGVLSFVMPGGFEREMPAIAEWFHENPPADAGPGSGTSGT